MKKKKMRKKKKKERDENAYELLAMFFLVWNKRTED